MSLWVALPLHQKKMPLQIHVLMDEKETALLQAARESLSLLLCGGRGRHDSGSLAVLYVELLPSRRIGLAV